VDYDDIMTTADEDRAFDKDQERHNRDGHESEDPSWIDCLVCASIREDTYEDDEL
jgi:hypothetical protein